jgi:hypothetical protein
MLGTRVFVTCCRDVSVQRVARYLCCPMMLLVFFVGCEEEAPPPPPEPKPVEVALPTPPPRPVITQTQYDKLLFDALFPDVVEQLGMDPSRQASTYDEGAEYTAPSVTSWYFWDNSDGSYIKLGFTNKRLTDKASQDLPEAQ